LSAPREKIFSADSGDFEIKDSEVFEIAVCDSLCQILLLKADISAVSSNIVCSGSSTSVAPILGLSDDFRSQKCPFS
jgi:hypothetical protein